MSIKFGFVSAILPEMPLEDVLSFAATTGYECVELMCWPVGKAERRYAGVTHLDTSIVNCDEAERIKELLASKGVFISGLGYYQNPLTPHVAEAEMCIEHLKEVIRMARRLDVPVVNTFIGRDWTKTVDENWPRFLEVWPPIVQCAEDNGVKIGIENCPMLFSKDEWPGGKNLATSPAIWRRMFEVIPSKKFGLNLDPSHLLWLGIDVVRVVKEFGSKIYHVHAKDAVVNMEGVYQHGILADKKLDIHTPKLPAGNGNVRWKAFFQALAESGYDGPVCVEVEDREYEGTLELRKKALVISLEYLKLIEAIRVHKAAMAATQA